MRLSTRLPVLATIAIGGLALATALPSAVALAAAATATTQAPLWVAHQFVASDPMLLGQRGDAGRGLPGPQRPVTHLSAQQVRQAHIGPRVIGLAACRRHVS